MKKHHHIHIKKHLKEAYSNIGGYMHEHEAKEHVKKGAKSVFYGAGLFYADMSGYKSPKHKKKAQSLAEMF